MTDIGAKIAAALVACQAEMPKVHKGKTARLDSYSYNYADLADVVEAAKPVLEKHGLAFVSAPQQTDGRFELVGMVVHESGEAVTGSLPLHGNTMQTLGSSLTYGRRYLLGCLTGIVTDDDDDGQAATHAQQKAEKEQRAKQAEKDDYNAAKREVKAPWEKAHGAWDPNAMTTAYEEWSASPIGDADATSLRNFAGSL